MPTTKWSEIKRRKGVPMERRVYTYAIEPDGPAWLLRVVERPELMTSVPTAELDRAMDVVRDLIATVDQLPLEGFEVRRQG